MSTIVMFGHICASITFPIVHIVLNAVRAIHIWIISNLIIYRYMQTVLNY